MRTESLNEKVGQVSSGSRAHPVESTIKAGLLPNSQQELIALASPPNAHNG